MSMSKPCRLASASRPGVRMAPHAMQLTRTPLRVHAAAIDPVRLFRPALAAAYTGACGIASRPAPEEMLTIAPLPCSIIGLAAARDRYHALDRLRFNTSCHSSSVHFISGLVAPPPALFTSTSRR